VAQRRAGSLCIRSTEFLPGAVITVAGSSSGITVGAPGSSDAAAGSSDASRITRSPYPLVIFVAAPMPLLCVSVLRCWETLRRCNTSSAVQYEMALSSMFSRWSLRLLHVHEEALAALGLKHFHVHLRGSCLKRTAWRGRFLSNVWSTGGLRQKLKNLLTGCGFHDEVTSSCACPPLLPPTPSLADGFPTTLSATYTRPPTSICEKPHSVHLVREQSPDTFVTQPPLTPKTLTNPQPLP